MSLLETFNWPKAAKELSKKITLDQLDPGCIRFLFNNSNEPWGIACSGGADSLSLLLLIYGHFFDKVKDITVFHYNHKLRGTESDEEEEFVRNCCNELGLRFICGEGDAFIKDRSEGSLRTKRHKFFNESLKIIGGNILLLGHQREDVAEMMLMRLARGSGTGGLCAPRPIHSFGDYKVHVRPLLNIGKRLLLESLEEVSVTWCKDSSNEGEYYFRNRIRRNVIPEWEAACIGDLWKGVGRSRELLEEDDVALEEWLESVLDLSELNKGDALLVDVLAGKPKALYRRILHQWLQVNNISKHFNTVSFDILLEKVMSKEDFQISAGAHKVVFHEGTLDLEKIAEEVNILKDFEERIEDGVIISFMDKCCLEAKEVILSDVLKKRIFNGEIDPKCEVYLKFDKSMSFKVRFWRDGDRYKPLGSPGGRKLQDMFTDRKIAIEKRKVLPIVYEERYGIAWCPGLPIAESFKIDEGTVFALNLTYK